MANRLIIDGNTVYEIDEECEKERYCFLQKYCHADDNKHQQDWNKKERDWNRDEKENVNK